VAIHAALVKGPMMGGFPDIHSPSIQEYGSVMKTSNAAFRISQLMLNRDCIMRFQKPLANHQLHGPVCSLMIIPV
jgi:hypothetical protein